MANNDHSSSFNTKKSENRQEEKRDRRHSLKAVASRFPSSSRRIRVERKLVKESRQQVDRIRQSLSTLTEESTVLNQDDTESIMDDIEDEKDASWIAKMFLGGGSKSENVADDLQVENIFDDTDSQQEIPPKSQLQSTIEQEALKLVQPKVPVGFTSKLQAPRIQASNRTSAIPVPRVKPQVQHATHLPGPSINQNIIPPVQNKQTTRYIKPPMQKTRIPSTLNSRIPAPLASNDDIKLIAKSDNVTGKSKLPPPKIISGNLLGKRKLDNPPSIPVPNTKPKIAMEKPDDGSNAGISRLPIPAIRVTRSTAKATRKSQLD